MPLVWVKGCDVPDKPRTSDKKPLKGEDKEMVEKALRGEWIPAKVLEEMQEERFKNNQPYLVLPVRSYADERDELRELRKRAKEDFIYYILFTLEQLELSTEKTNISITGDINKQSELYEILSTYVRNINFLNSNNSIFNNQTEIKKHSNFILLG